MRASLHQHVLIVEDDAIIGLELESILREEGYDVVGPAASVSEALACLAGECGLDGAVLDVNLGNEDVFSVADALSAARIPFLFLTGHSNSMLPTRHNGRPVIRKPYARPALIATLASVIAGENQK